MKVSYKWLSEYVDVSGYSAEELAEKLTRAGIEVDIVESRNLGVTNVVVGYVKSKEHHPDADKLNVCIVDAGQSEDLQIVCGAANVAAGQKVPVALVGAELPGGLKIKRAKLRGVESQGMICSARELGMNDKLLPKEQQEGILVLQEETHIGDSILEVLALDDKVLELDLTPNRSDCLSMIGTAYEIAAILDRGVKLPDAEGELTRAASGVRAADRIAVTISASEQCSHYTARLIEGVRVGASPQWMQNRLMAAGVRPINNIVDITNYVMLEYGQPLHAFDADKLAGGRIDVRLAKPGEKLVTLDDVERNLEPHMLLITDAEKPVGLAGVMGGANSEVSAATIRIVLESAKFSGSSVRKTSRQLGLRSEASLRFEKEVDPEAVIPALDRAAALMAAYADGKVAEGIVEAKSGGREPVSVELSIARVNNYLGTSLTSEQVRDILEKLHFQYEVRSNEMLLVHVPSRRGDIVRDVDLIEEVARLYGYDNIPTTLMSGETSPGSLTREQFMRRAIRNVMTQSGLHEVVTYTFVQPGHTDGIPGLFPHAKPIALSMPMSEERSVLRTSLVPNLIETAIYNRNRNNDNLALFEIGKVFVTEQTQLSAQPTEKLLLSALLAGKRTGEHWSYKASDVDFYDLKGVLERLIAFLAIEGVEYKSASPDGFHPGRTADILVTGKDGSLVTIGRIGQLHPALQKQKDLADTYVLEVELEPLFQLADFTIEFAALPRYPASARDLALVVDSGVPVAQMEQVIRSAAGELLESVSVFDIYTGEKLGHGKKSVAFALVYRHGERTLNDEEIAELQLKVVEALERNFAAELRK